MKSKLNMFRVRNYFTPNVYINMRRALHWWISSSKIDTFKFVQQDHPFSITNQSNSLIKQSKIICSPQIPYFNRQFTHMKSFDDMERQNSFQIEFKLILLSLLLCSENPHCPFLATVSSVLIPLSIVERCTNPVHLLPSAIPIEKLRLLQWQSQIEIINSAFTSPLEVVSAAFFLLPLPTMIHREGKTTPLCQ